MAISTIHLITCDQFRVLSFRVLPMPDLVVNYLDSMAAAEGYSRGIDPTRDDGAMEHDARLATSVPLPDMMAFDPTMVPLDQSEQDRPDAGVNDDVNAPADMPGDHDEVTVAEDALPSSIPCILIGIK
jgi:hypothetical protein